MQLGVQLKRERPLDRATFQPSELMKRMTRKTKSQLGAKARPAPAVRPCLPIDVTRIRYRWLSRDKLVGTSAMHLANRNCINLPYIPGARNLRGEITRSKLIQLLTATN